MKIRWTQAAVADLTHICDYTLERFGPPQAHRMSVELVEAAESLTEHPNRGRSGRRPGTRELVIPGLPFLIIYRIRGDAIEIGRILHGSQKWP